MQITLKLRDEHEAIMQLVGVFRDILSHPVAPPDLDMVSFRDEFSKQLFGHLTREDWLLYPSLLQSSDNLVAGTAQSFISEMGGLLACYKAWSNNWPAEKVVGEWSLFVFETTRLLEALSNRIERENSELYILVEKNLFKAA